MIKRNSFSVCFVVLILIISFIKASIPDANGYEREDPNCETVYTTVTAPASSTFTYTSTEIVPAGSAGIVTKYVDKPYSVELVTSTIEGKTRTVSFVTTSTKFIGATTTKISTNTVTTFPSAVTTIFSTETVVVFVKGTLKVTYPPPVITISSENRYTGAPTSLWLSVI